MPQPTIQLTAGGLHLRLDGAELTLSDAERGHRLAVLPIAGGMLPWLDGHACEAVVRGVTVDGDGIAIEQEAAGCRVRTHWRGAGGGEISGFDDTHRIEDVVFSDMRFQGKPIDTLDQLRLRLVHTNGIRLESAVERPWPMDASYVAPRSAKS